MSSKTFAFPLCVAFAVRRLFDYMHHDQGTVYEVVFAVYLPSTHGTYSALFSYLKILAESKFGRRKARGTVAVYSALSNFRYCIVSPLTGVLPIPARLSIKHLLFSAILQHVDVMHLTNDTIEHNDLPSGAWSTNAAP